MTFPGFQAEIEAECATTRSQLPARGDERIGVHVLSEFVYCPRAGTLAFEGDPDDRGEEFEPAPALGGLPLHDADRIARALEELQEHLPRPAGWVAGLSIVTLAAAWWNPTLAVGPLLADAVWIRELVKLLRLRRILGRRLREAEAAAVREPDWQRTTEQQINWWELIRAGFDSIQKRESLVDTELQLAGRPWRVLHRDVWQLPVLRIRVDDEPDDPRRYGRLRIQQFARLAAYAYLIHEEERLLAPWAIVLFGSGDDGVAVPLRPTSWKAFREGLRLAREQIRKLQTDRHYEPPAADNRRACLRCHLGRPRQVDGPAKAGSVQPFVTRGRNGVLYHSPCGDRFRWVPPHEQADALGLTDE